MSTTIRIKGMKELLAKIDNIQQMESVKTAMKAAAIHVKGKASKYPPESEANKPGRVPSWYERGYGTRWNLAGGGTGGKQTSETLGKKWTTSSRDSGLTQVIGNNVSYGPFVQDEGEQAAFHKKRGWNTIQDVAADEADTVLEFIQDAVDKALES